MTKKGIKTDTKKATKNPVSANPKKVAAKKDETEKEDPKLTLKKLNEGLELCANTLTKLLRETPIDVDNYSVIAISSRIEFLKNKQQLIMAEKQIIESELLK
jgi:hypothetical protein